MKYILDIPDSKKDIADLFFKNISFIKNVKKIAPNEITNEAILKSMEDYETGKINPVKFKLSDLKKLVNA